MRKLMMLAGLAMALSCQPSSKEFPWVEGSYQDVLQSADTRMVMLEFYSDG